MYVGSVLGRVGLIALGGMVLRAVGMPQAQVALVVAAVGLHFLPFAWAFSAPVFRVLGWAMTGIGLVGVGAAVVTGQEGAAAAAVLAGLVMFLVMTALALRPWQPDAAGPPRDPAVRPVHEVADRR